MLGLKKENNKTFLKEISEKNLKINEVEIKILMSGICKTDIYVYQNKINSNNIILGHECCGIISKSKSKKFKEGDFVTVNPVFKSKEMIGIDYDGCFAEKIIINSEQVFKIPTNFSYNLGAYIEPITASLSPLKSKFLNKNMSILILGSGRIAELTKHILNLTGYNNIEIFKNENKKTYDCIIETGVDSYLINKVPMMLKDNGLFIIKSRNPDNYSINFYEFVKKDIIIESLYYYDYEKTIDIIKDNIKSFDYLFGNTYNLNDWQKAFNDSENKKAFLRI